MFLQKDKLQQKFLNVATLRVFRLNFLFFSCHNAVLTFLCVGTTTTW